MVTRTDSDELRELELLEALVEDPEVRQVDLATRLGVAVGTVNWLLKRLAAKGFLKVKRIGRWRWRYLLTPRGLTRKARLTKEYMRLSMNLYRSTRQKAQQLLQQVKQAGYRAVHLDETSPDDLMDVCRLTCLEQGVSIIDKATGIKHTRLPLLRVAERSLMLEWPAEMSSDVER